MVDQNSGPAVPQESARPTLASQQAGERDGPGQDRQRQAQARRPPAAHRWALRNWRVRWRLLALVVIPTVTALVLGGFRIQAARDTAATFAQTSQLAALGGDISSLVQALEDERDITAGYLTTHQLGEPQRPGSSGSAADATQAKSVFGQLIRQQAVTNGRLAAVQSAARQIGPGFPRSARTDLTSALSELSALSSLRTFVSTKMNALPMIQNYTSVISPLVAFDNDIASGSPNAQLAQTVSAFSAVAQMADQVSQQRAILYASLFQSSFDPGVLDALTSAQSNQHSDLAAFQTEAANLPGYFPASGAAPAGFSPTVTEAAQFNDSVAGPAVDQALATEQDAIVAGEAGNGVGAGSAAAQAWFSNMTAQLSEIRAFQSDQLAAITAQARSLQQAAGNSQWLTAVVVLVLLLLVMLFTIVVGQSMVGPLRRLRADALDVAGRRLPDVVRALSESQEADESIQIEPIGINSTDEIGEVARAFDQVHSEAVRLAAEEALLRLNLNAMFVNLSRRSQSLIERQLSIIDSLEQSEQDPDRLSSLFRLDHLATRMRRNSENLLVLAGHEAPRKWTQPVPLVDVLRAAISEIEQYDRVTLNVQPGVVISGRGASDVVHLVAELVENATAFSAETTQVAVTGQPLESGGVLIEVTDEGLGIPEPELQYVNWRLDNPPVIDVAASRRMGLFVVGRLAARHGVRVRLRHAVGGGLSALIWLPEAVAEAETAPPLGTLRRRFDADGYASAAPVSAPAGTPAPAVPVPGAPIRRLRTPAAAAAAASVRAAPAGSEPGAAVITVATDGAGEARLPIYDSVESDWFRRSGTAFRAGSRVGSWTSPADEGFLAAQATASPVVGDMTAAGLPRRLPSANLVPGSVGGPAPLADGQPPEQPTGPQRVPQSQESQQPALAGGRQPRAGARGRSPEVMRSRLANLQRGTREGRAAAPWNFGLDED